MVWFFIFAAVIGGLSDEDVILSNDTGLDIANVMIDSRSLHEMHPWEKILISVTPEKHHLRLIFRGGGDIDWKHFDFRGVHEIWFVRGDQHGNEFKARVQ